LGDQVKALVCCLLAIGTASVARAGEAAAAREIRAGRAALESNRPGDARRDFAAALGQPGASRDDRFAANVGLGKAELWLGRDRAAERAFRHATRFAGSRGDRRVAAVGLAQALNALEYYDSAFALAAPFARSDAAATAELLRAANALGRADQVARYSQGGPSAELATHLGVDLARQRADAELALSTRVELDLAFSHDSDGLDLRRYALGAWLPGRPGGALFPTWHVEAATTTIADPLRSQRLQEVAAGAAARVGDAQRLDLSIGAGSVDGWTFLQGKFAWHERLSDRVSLDAAVERHPILTTTALLREVAFDTYSTDASLRASDHWYVIPTYIHQSFSDGNQRDGGALKVLLSPYDIPNTRSALGAEVVVRGYDSSKPSVGTYFSPGQYRLRQLSLIGVHAFSPDWRLRAVAGLGTESINGVSERAYSWRLSLTGRLPHNGRIALNVGRDSFASVAGGGSGYWNDTAAATIVFPL